MNDLGRLGATMSAIKVTARGQAKRDEMANNFGEGRFGRMAIEVTNKIKGDAKNRHTTESTTYPKNWLVEEPRDFEEADRSDGPPLFAPVLSSKLYGHTPFVC